MILFLLIAAAVTNPPQITFSQDSSQAARRSLANKFADTVSVKDAPWLAVGDGSANDAGAINAALTAHTGLVHLPASSSCYNVGSTTITIPSGRTLQGEGYGSPGNGAACITYTGSGCAILFESTKNAALLNLDVHVNSASSTAAGVCFSSGTSNAEFNRVENVSITADQVRVSGQVGLLINDTSHGVFWNHFRMLRFKSWDTSLFMSATGNTQGVNSNQFYDLMSYAHNTAYLLRSGNKQVTDNRFHGLTCSRSDATQLGTTHCLMMGDDNVGGIFGNSVYGLDNDSGSPDVCGVLGTTSGANYVDATCASGGGFQDNSTSGFANGVFNHQGLGSVTNLLSVGNLVTSKGAVITGTVFAGPTGTTGNPGGTVQVFGGVGSPGQPGGPLQLFGGTAGTGNAKAGDVLLTPGSPTGTGTSGTAVIGPTSGGGIGSGVRIRSSRVIIGSKPFGPIDCAGANLGPTISQILDSSLFSCATTQTITTPSAQGTNGIIQNLPGSASFTNGPVAVGDEFDLLTMISTAHANFTLVGGAGVTLLGNVVANKSTALVRCEVTSITTNAETMTCRAAGAVGGLDGSQITTGSVSQAVGGTGRSSAVTCAAGDFITSNGTTYSCATPAGSGVSLSTANTWTATQTHTPSTTNTSGVVGNANGSSPFNAGIKGNADASGGSSPGGLFLGSTTGRALVATGGIGMVASQISGGGGTGSGDNGTALILSAPGGGTGTGAGNGYALSMSGNTIKPPMLMSATGANPTAPDVGGVWTLEDGTNATALKFRSSGAGGVSPATYILAPLVANSVSFTTSTTVTLPSNNMTCVCGAKSGGGLPTCDVSGTTLTIAQTGTHSVAYQCLMTQ